MLLPPGRKKMKPSNSTWLRLTAGVLAANLTYVGSTARADELQLKWVTSWAVPMQGAYVPPRYDLQPNLDFALPHATARNQTFRMIVKPDLWGQVLRIRLSNAFGTQPVTFSAVSVALQKHQANIVPGSSRTVTFGGAKLVAVPAGESVFSDPIALPPPTPVGLFSLRRSSGNPDRNLAVSFAVSGSSGSVSFHRDAPTTSYISPPNSGDATIAGGATEFPFSTNSSFFLSELDVVAAAETVVVVALGDSALDRASVQSATPSLANLKAR
jgi:hypothetical protein